MELRNEKYTKIDSIISESVFILEDNILVPDALIDYKLKSPNLRRLDQLLIIANELKDKCEFTVLFMQLMKSMINSKLIVDSFKIDPRKCNEILMGNNFVRQHYKFINWVWEIIYNMNIWPLLKFIMSIIISFNLSKTNVTEE